MHISKLLLLLPFLAAASAAPGKTNYLIYQAQIPFLHPINTPPPFIVLAERGDLSEDTAKGYTRSLETHGYINAKRELDEDNAKGYSKRDELDEDTAKGYTRSLDKRDELDEDTAKGYTRSLNKRDELDEDTAKGYTRSLNNKA